ncbi:MAG: hypothetical protein PSX81_13855 [bacterium]|nr:hypothetical protein [bacterium]
MNIIFICGSLESGRDGVGDYTRRLAGQLNKLGNNASVIAINDQFVSNLTIAVQNSEDSEIAIMRIPKQISDAARFKYAREWVEQNQPDWISLQYVPFAFHDKGLPYTWTNYMELLTAKNNLHIMFHELWVGMSKESSYKEKIWGRLQRSLIKSTINRLKPKVITTQTQLYINYLNTLGFNAFQIPLFGNIERSKSIKDISDKNEKSNDDISFIIFGGIHANAPAESFAKFVAIKFANKLNKVKLILIGRCGHEQNTWIHAWKNEGMQTLVLGEQSQSVISRELSNANFGISTTPTALLDKSGSVAAMLEHGLKVISVSRKWQPTIKGPINIADGIVLYDPNQTIDILELSKFNENLNSLESVTNQFVEKLNSINING